MIELSVFGFTLIIIGSYIAAFANAAFGVGGAFIMLGLMTNLLPIQEVIPLHTPLMFGSLISRVVVYWNHIYWPVVKPFALGCIVGVLAGSKIYVDLPEWAIALVLALLMLSVWLPPSPWGAKIPKLFFGVGVIHSFLSTVFAYGGVFHPVILRTGLGKYQITATTAGALFIMGLMKIIGYSSVGFDYTHYRALIIAVFVISFLGTWKGRQFIGIISERQFQWIFKAFMTFFGCRLLYQAWMLI